MGSDCCQHKKEENELVTTRQNTRKESMRVKSGADRETPMSNEIKLTKNKIINYSDLLNGEDYNTIEAKNVMGYCDTKTPYDNNTQDLYLHSLDIFQTINRVKARPSILVDKIDYYLEGVLDNGFCLIMDDNNNPYYMPKNILLDLKEFLLRASPSDYIMSEEPLYQIALKYSDSILRNDMGVSRESNIQTIARNYSDTEIQIKDFILFDYNYLDPYSIILLLLENAENRKCFFQENFQFGTVICSVNIENIPYTLILFIKEKKTIKFTL